MRIFETQVKLKQAERFAHLRYAENIYLRPERHVVHMLRIKINLNQFLMAVNIAGGSIYKNQRGINDSRLPRGRAGFRPPLWDRLTAGRWRALLSVGVVLLQPAVQSSRIARSESRVDLHAFECTRNGGLAVL